VWSGAADELIARAAALFVLAREADVDGLASTVGRLARLRRGPELVLEGLDLLAELSEVAEGAIPPPIRGLRPWLRSRAQREKIAEILANHSE